MLHRRIAKNDFLTKIGVRDDPTCSFCNGEQENQLHLFWSCPKVASFWHDLIVRLTLLHITPEHYTIDPLVALGLKPDSSKNHPQINFSCLLARYYIWMSKKKKKLDQRKKASYNTWNQFKIQRQMQKALSPKSGNFWTHYFGKPRLSVISVSWSSVHFACFFGLWYISSAITGF